MKAFIGTGLLGSGFIKAMLQRGEAVQVWNRTATKATALEPLGAKAFSHVADAVRGASRIHVVLKDDETVDAVLEEASAGFEKDVVIIDHTTTSAKGAVHRVQYWKNRGFAYVHAPVFMNPQNAQQSTGFMLLSGDQDMIKRLEPELSVMTGKLINFGPEDGKAAGIKLAGNLFLLCLTAGLADALALCGAQGIAPQELLTLFQQWNPGAGVPGRLEKILGGNFNDPSWELSMARKDAGLMLTTAEAAGTSLTLIPAIASVMDEWLAKGHAQDDWSVIAKEVI